MRRGGRVGGEAVAAHAGEDGGGVGAAGGGAGGEEDGAAEGFAAEEGGGGLVEGEVGCGVHRVLGGGEVDGWASELGWSGAREACREGGLAGAGCTGRTMPGPADLGGSAGPGQEGSRAGSADLASRPGQAT